MTIQRQYNLPNCTLVLEGLGGAGFPNAEVRQPMATLLSAECQFTGLETTLSGGRDFLESLAIAVNQYAQELLSGVHSFRPSTLAQGIELQRLDANHHRLKVRPPDVPEGSGIETQLSKEVDLTTVQLFDLVEAIDQFYADSHTMPDLALQLQPLSKRYTRSSVATTQQAVPAAIGVSSLALAAIAFFLVPIPQVRPPADLVPKPASSSAPGVTPSAAPPKAGSSPTPTGSPIASSTTSPTASPTTSPTASPTADADALESPLSSSPEITDAAQVEALGKQLKTKVDTAWKNRAGFTQDLVYQVGVTKDGTIVGYKPANEGSLTNAKLTPLLDLLSRQPSTEPIAQFKVLFAPSGVLEVSPWKSTTSAKPSAPIEVTATKQMEDILPKLRSQILQASPSDKVNFSKDLVYRVRVKLDGTIVDYKPDSPAAFESVKETPLPKLGKPADESVAPTEPFALFRVVFRPNGTIELTPWRGWVN
jgi:Domain of unknown function (DUF4335)